MTECPGDLTCKNGFCVAEDEACAPGFARVTTGAGFACALDEIGDPWCWGANDHHQIDPGDRPHYARAHRLGGRRYTMLSAGRGHVCGISEGRIFCWGMNDFGQISGSIAGDVEAPTEIEVTGGPTSWSYVAAGYSTTCAIATDGRLFCWGSNRSGELGNGSTTDSGVPIPVETDIADWIAVASNGVGNAQHTCAISASSGLYCWGSNAYGQIAQDAAAGDSLVPSPVALPGVPTSVAPGAYATCATTDAGELYCWGYGELGQIGDPELVDYRLDENRYIYTPTRASLLDGWRQVSLGELVACGVRTGGEIWCWGHSRNGNGLGTGVWAPGARPAFTQIASGASQISVGFNHYLDNEGAQDYDLETTCFVGAGAIRCWGDNRFGQLGQGGPSESPVPLEIAGGRTWSTIATGLRHSCGVSDGQLSCWGSTLRGAIDGVVAGTMDAPCGAETECDPGKPLDVGPATSVAVGHDHTCALSGVGVSCWGDNSFVQLGTRNLPDPRPVIVPGEWGALVDLHGVTTCARRPAGETHCWGSGLEPAAIPELASMTAISSGGVVSAGYTGVACFLAGGETFCSGDNSLGQFGNGPEAGTCGDLVCTAGECETCPQDCGACTTCGNGACDNGETAATCSLDCGGTGYTNLGRGYFAISVGWDATTVSGNTVCAVTPGGTVECWGNNPRGMITGEIDSTTKLPVAHVTTPRTIAGLSACTAVAVGVGHACALCQGRISCWGDHRRGAVGAGPLQNDVVTTPRVIEVELEAGDSWAQLSAGIGFSCARTTNGRGYCWGSNQHGAVGLGGSASTLPILVRAE
jgi:alpha-tubulin suppressor-like RCC1 family protein